MEIRIEERMTGRELHDQIIVTYGSREALEEAAEGSDTEAQADLVTLGLLEEDESRLDTIYTRETVVLMEPGDLQRFTGKRLEMLKALAESDEPLNVTGLASHLGRDKKNVSEDLQILEDLGLVQRQRHGREKLAWPRGNEIRIVLDSGAARG